jgi:ABC-2 type transport system permease protein
MTNLLLRPLSPVFDALASEVAGKVVYMLFIVPVTALLALLLQPELHITLANGLAFILSLALAWALRFFWGYWLALLAFWATRANALLGLQDSLVFLLAGQVAPIALLPGPMREAATVLPFRYMVGFPVEVLTGQLDAVNVWIGLGIQAGWLIIALALFVTLWRAGVRRYSAVGG